MNASSMLRRVLLVPVAACLLSSQPVFAQGLLQTLQASNPQPNDAFGQPLAVIADLNGDGVPEVAVGAPQKAAIGTPGEGQVFIFSGLDGQLLATLSPPAPGVAGAFGAALADAGDVDGDGVTDLLVGAPLEDVDVRPAQGRAYLISGADGSLLHALDDPQPVAEARFGAAVAGLGDIDGDGVPDVAVAAPGKDLSGGQAQGEVVLFSGADGGPLRTLSLPVPTPFAAFGTALAVLPDLDGDGIPELAVGAPDHPDDGVYVFSGGSGALQYSLANPTPLAVGENAARSFGFALAVLDDVDGDGVADFAVGAPRNDPDPSQMDQGKAFVFSGASGELLHVLEDPDPQLNTDEDMGALLGFALSPVPDIDMDGVGDIAVGAPQRNGPTHVMQGEVLIFSGTSGELLRRVPHPDPQPEAQFGAAVAGLASPGPAFLPRLTVGAPAQNLGAAQNAGAAYLLELELHVRIDIKPGDDANTINPGSRGVIAVALLSAAAFDATTEVDRTSLTFGHTGIEPSLDLRGRGVPNCTELDADRDGLDDLLCHFRTAQTGIRAGTTEAFLQGRTVEGLPFSGRDDVRTVPR